MNITFPDFPRCNWILSGSLLLRGLWHHGLEPGDSDLVQFQLNFSDHRIVKAKAEYGVDRTHLQASESEANQREKNIYKDCNRKFFTRRNSAELGDLCRWVGSVRAEPNKVRRDGIKSCGSVLSRFRVRSNEHARTWWVDGRGDNIVLDGLLERIRCCSLAIELTFATS